MSPYRRPPLKFIATEFMKTPLKRKIKFAWVQANKRTNPFVLLFVHCAVLIFFIVFDRSDFASLFAGLIIALITIARMFWFWFLFLIESKKRNEQAKRFEELQKPFLFQEFWNDYTCNSCKKIFQTKEKAVQHAIKCFQMFQCNSCDAMFESQEQVELHNATCS